MKTLIDFFGGAFFRIRIAKQSDGNQIPADFCISTIPVKQLAQALDVSLPDEVKAVSNGLMYRDLITVGLLSNANTEKSTAEKIDQCFHIYDSALKASRLQVLNGRNPELDSGQTWISLDYLTNDGDEISELSDGDLVTLAKSEATTICNIDTDQVIDHLVVRTDKAYPIYSGSYKNFGVLKDYLDSIGNLTLVGRNGLHQYNNVEHAIRTAIDAVAKISTQNSNLIDDETAQV